MNAPDIWQRLAERRSLDTELRNEIVVAFGTRGAKALAAIDDGRVLKYLDFFVVVGKTSRYIVEEEFCTCSDFMYRGRTCWHLLAARIAELTVTYVSVNRWYHEEIDTLHTNKPG